MRSQLSFVCFFAAIVQQAYTACVQCGNDQPTVASPNKNIFAGLSEEEVGGVADVLTGKLNLTTTPGQSSRDNFIFGIELLQPNKSDALLYLDESAGAPKRYARATVAFGSSDEPYLQQYVVGPLPATNATAINPLTYPFNNQTPGKTKVHPIFIGPDGLLFLTQFGTDVEDITKALWNGTFADGGVTLRTQFPLLEEDGKTFLWAEFVGSPTTGSNSESVLPLGVSVKFDVTDREWENWVIDGWYTLGKFYSSTEEFQAAVSSGSVKPPPNVDGDWTSTDKQGDSLPLDELPPPISVSEGSKRFTVDAQEQYVTWMDFTFFLSVSAATGISLYDVRYKGKRIVYELGLQEALTHYAGSAPVQSHTTFFDSVGGIGTSMTSLVNGYDCPNYATYLNASMSAGPQFLTFPNAICLFEYDQGYPIRRHYHTTAGTTSVAKNIAFTVRSISTVGNYDFLFEYNFFLDGGIEVSARASGYISAAYYAGNEDYGFKIHDFLSGSLHDHMFTFKADLDIAGEKNSVQKIEFTPETVKYPWSDTPQNTMKAIKSFITSESESSIDWAANDADIYAIVNKDAANKFGEFPGFRIKRTSGTSHLTIQNSSNIGNAGHFTEHDLYITQRKPTEPWAASEYNAYHISDPLVDFSKFLDGDSLDQEDLVVWFNLGMHHIPHTGDLPNTLMTSAHSSIRFEPLNYFERDVSSETSQQVKVNVTDGTVQSFGAQSANCSVDFAELGIAGQ